MVPVRRARPPCRPVRTALPGAVPLPHPLRALRVLEGPLLLRPRRRLARGRGPRRATTTTSPGGSAPRAATPPLGGSGAVRPAAAPHLHGAAASHLHPAGEGADSFYRNGGVIALTARPVVSSTGSAAGTRKPGLTSPLPNTCSMAYGRPVALSVGSPDLPEDPPHLGRLAAELRRYRLRYGAPAPSPAQRLDDRVRSHRARLRFIDEQMVELAAERRRLVQEIAGYEKGLALVLRTEIERLRERHGEAWSPVAIRAYRVWQLDGGRMRGARTVWPDPWLVAECARGGGRAEVPHSDGRCGPPG